jgi:hypothetical protein
VTPFTELLGKGPMGPRLLARFQLKQTLMHPIQGVVDQLGGLVGGHGNSPVWRRCTSCAGETL